MKEILTTVPIKYRRLIFSESTQVTNNILQDIKFINKTMHMLKPSQLPSTFVASALFLLLLISCSRNSKQWDAIDKLPADSLLSIPTYDGSNQVVHPDILASGDEFLLAITPYPYFNNKHENPCLYTSKDGCSFRAYPHLPLPLVESPPNGFNCDPDIFFFDGRLYILYLELNDGAMQYLKLLSFDENTSAFSSSTVWSQHISDGVGRLILSPTAVIEKDFNLFFIEKH